MSHEADVRVGRDQRQWASGGAPAGTSAVLRLEGITKSFGPVVALRGVDVEFLAGEVHAIVGENGAGKSTLIAVAAGAVRPDAGSISLNGVGVSDLTPDGMRDGGVAVVYQHPALLPDLSIAENLVLGVPGSMRPGLARAHAWARELLTDNGLDLDVRTRVADLGLADRHLLEIAKALASRPRVLILDEPTEPLSERQSATLFERISDLKRTGVAIVYISHRLPEVKRIADRLTVLRDGSSEGSYRAEALDEDRILRLIVGRPISSAFPAKGTRRDHGQLTLQQFRGPGLSPVDLVVRAGEIVGLAGIDGNGQQQFIRALAGAEPGSGAVLVDGRRADLSSTASALRSGIAYIAGDRQTEGLLATLSVRENMTLMSLPRYARFGVLRRSREDRAVENGQRELAIKMAAPEVPVSTLSGGNQQKVLFGRVLAAEPSVVLADEPTQGVDAGARLQLYRALRNVAEGGAAVLALSSDVTELRGLCDRVLVFSRGTVVAELDGEEVTEEAITRASLTAQTVREESARTAGGNAVRRLLGGDYAPAFILAAIVLLVGAVVAGRNNHYLSEVNLSNFLYLVAVLGFLALGQSVVVLTGGIDLSVGPMVALTSVTMSYLMTEDAPLSLVLGIVALVALAATVGLVNGFLIEQVRISPVIATLVTFFAVQGIALLLRLTPGGVVATTVSDLPYDSVGFVPVVLLVLVLLVVVMEVGLRRSLWGLRLRAVGSQVGTAHRLGVATTRTTVVAYVLCSLLAVVGGMVFTGLTGVGDAKSGIDYTLITVAAVILGGAAVTGGRGSFVGVVAGALVLQQAANITTFLSLGSQWQYWFVGILLLTAATFYSAVRSAGRRASAAPGR